MLKTLLVTASVMSVMAGTSSVSANDDLSLSFNVTGVSEYRFRGISVSDKDPAIQGAINLEHSSGFFLSAWGSSIADFNGANMELDLIGGYSHAISDNSALTLGVIAYIYPGGDNTDYYEIFSTFDTSVGDTILSVGANWAWNQDNIGDDSNIYLWTSASTPIPGTPVSFDAGLGYEDGGLADDKWDWRLGLTTSWKQFSVGLHFIDTNEGFENADSTILLSVGVDF